ncbi:MAG: hypothetical protein ACKVGW_17620, partial [Verrucomicrobiia bacterium]
VDTPLKGKDVDGKSFRSVLSNSENESEREALVLRDAKGRRALVSGSFKYIGNTLPNNMDSAKLKEELYDLDNDPGETTNIIKSNPELAKALNESLAKVSRDD